MFPGFPWSLLKYTIIGLDSTCTCTHLQLRLTLKCFSICLVNEIIKYVNLVCVCFLEVLTTTRLNGVCSIRVYFYRWFLTVLTMENILTMLLCHCVPVWAYHTSLPALMATRPSWSATHHWPSLRMVWIVLYSISLVHKSICSGSDNIIVIHLFIMTITIPAKDTLCSPILIEHELASEWLVDVVLAFISTFTFILVTVWL